jgi:hypothetical protein
MYEAARLNGNWVLLALNRRDTFNPETQTKKETSC